MLLQPSYCLSFRWLGWWLSGRSWALGRTSSTTTSTSSRRSPSSTTSPPSTSSSTSPPSRSTSSSSAAASSAWSSLRWTPASSRVVVPLCRGNHGHLAAHPGLHPGHEPAAQRLNPDRPGLYRRYIMHRNFIFHSCSLSLQSSTAKHLTSSTEFIFFGSKINWFHRFGVSSDEFVYSDKKVVLNQ